MELLTSTHKKSAWLMTKSCRRLPGFTLIEILVALALLGILMSVVVPNINRFRPGYERKALVSDLSALVSRTWQDALVTRQLHRVWFDFIHRTITIERDTGTKDMRGEEKFEEVSGQYIKATISLPEYIQIKDLFIDGIDQMHRSGIPGFKIEHAWFYIYPDGSIQEVVINLFDTSDTTQSEAGTRLGLVLSPFTAKFTAYDTFQQP